MVRLDRPRRTADGDRNKSRRDRDRAPDDGGECRCGGVRARRCRGDTQTPLVGSEQKNLPVDAKTRRRCEANLRAEHLAVPRLEDLKHQIHVRAPHLLEGLRPRDRVEVREHKRQALLP
jgi:hypothetical protein